MAEWVSLQVLFRPAPAGGDARLSEDGPWQLSLLGSGRTWGSGVGWLGTPLPSHIPVMTLQNTREANTAQPQQRGSLPSFSLHGAVQRGCAWTQADPSLSSGGAPGKSYKSFGGRDQGSFDLVSLAPHQMFIE